MGQVFLDLQDLRPLCEVGADQLVCCQALEPVQHPVHTGKSAILNIEIREIITCTFFFRLLFFEIFA